MAGYGYQQGFNQYQRMQTETATPGELIVMLYQGAIRFLNKSKEHFGQQDLEGAHANLVRAQNIVIELMSSLDLSTGPLAKNLFALYDFMYRRLVEANCKKDHAAIDEVLRLLRELLPAWEQAVASGTARPSGAQAAG